MEPQVGTPRRRLPAGRSANQSPGQLARTRSLAPTPAGLKYGDDPDGARPGILWYCIGRSVEVPLHKYIFKIRVGPSCFYYYYFFRRRRRAASVSYYIII